MQVGWPSQVANTALHEAIATQVTASQLTNEPQVIWPGQVVVPSQVENPGQVCTASHVIIPGQVVTPAHVKSWHVKAHVIMLHVI